MNSLSIFQAADVTDKPVAIVAIAREVVEQTIEALEHAEKDCADFQMVNTDQICDVVTALRAALDQPQGEQEPVAWCELDADRSGIAYFDGKPIIMTGPVGNEHHPDPLYTHSQRKPLTIERIKQILDECDEGQESAEHILSFARAVERAHNIK